METKLRKMPEYRRLEDAIMASSEKRWTGTIKGFKVEASVQAMGFLRVEVDGVEIANTEDWCVAFEALERGRLHGAGGVRRLAIYR